jgi:hypothetical protein
VLGVLIALALGAVATEIGWQIEILGAKHSLAAEMGEILGQAQERDRVDQCYRRRLNQISAIVEDAAKTGRLPPVGALGQPLLRTWSHGVWDSTLNAETAAHFDRDTLDNMSGAYEFVSLIGAANAREIDDWTRLAAISGPGRAFGADEANEMRAAIAAARTDNGLIALYSVRIRQVADAFGLPYDAKDVAKYGSRPLSDYALCGPISKAIPTGYGVSPIDGAVDQARAHPITSQSIGTKDR